MRYAREIVAATVAASTILVFELWTKGTKKKKGVHYGSFLIPPSERQYYDILRPDIRPHFQLLDKQVDAYVDTLLCQDFDEVRVCFKVEFETSGSSKEILHLPRFW